MLEISLYVTIRISILRSELFFTTRPIIGINNNNKMVSSIWKNKIKPERKNIGAKSPLS